MLTQKKAKCYTCERVFSGSSVTSPIPKEETAQGHPILKRKTQNIITRVAKDMEKIKISKKSTNKYKKIKNKSRKKGAFESSSEVFGVSVGAAVKEEEENENSMEPIEAPESEDGNEGME